MAEMHSDEYERIASLENTHWWYKSLHNLVLATLKNNFNNKEIKIIDAGCGTGGLITLLKGNGYSNVKGFDISEIAVNICVRKGLNVFLGDLNNISYYFNNHDADVIISNDNLYFLNETQQRKATDAMHRILKKEGLVIANIPSLKAFRGIHDVRVGIIERYHKGIIWKTFDAAKYFLMKATYWPFFLSPFIWLSRYKQRIKMKLNKNTNIDSDLNDEAKLINSVLFHLTDFENAFLNKKPFGSSLFLVMKSNAAY